MTRVADRLFNILCTNTVVRGYLNQFSQFFLCGAFNFELKCFAFTPLKTYNFPIHEKVTGLEFRVARAYGNARTTRSDPHQTSLQSLNIPFHQTICLCEVQSNKTLMNPAFVAVVLEMLGLEN
jgi:hypothetical protein